MSFFSGRRIWVMFRNAWRENLVPGLIIQSFAVVMVGSYYLVPAVRTFWTAWADFKHTYGLSYVFVSTALFGGLIPGAYMLWLRRIHAGYVCKNLLFLTLFWGYRGIEAELLYRFQSWCFGDNHQWLTVVKKVLVDQFVYNPFWASLVLAAACIWQQHNFAARPVVTEFTSRRFWSEYLPGMQLATWIVWIPAVSVVYCMPQELQIPLANLVLCFFVLVVTSLRKTN